MWEAYHTKSHFIHTRTCNPHTHIGVYLVVDVNCHLAKMVCACGALAVSRWISQSVCNKLHKFIKNTQTHTETLRYKYMNHILRPYSSTQYCTLCICTNINKIFLALALSNGNNQFDHLIFPVIVFPFAAVFDFEWPQSANQTHTHTHTNTFRFEIGRI